MARLDIGEALGEGFRLIGRRPLDTLVWGLAYFVFGILPTIAIMWWAAGDIMAMMKASQSGAEMSAPQMMASQLKFQALQPLMFIGSLVGRALVFCAVFRAVLTPEDRGFFYLRFSSKELWVGLVMLVQGVCMFLVIMAMFLPVIIIGAVAYAAAAHQQMAGWSVPVIMLTLLVGFGVFFWLLVRFSMAAPMSFVAGQFRLFESWSLTRGQGWGLFGLYFLVVLVVGCITVVLECLIAAVGFGALAASGLNANSLTSFFSQPPETLLAILSPFIIGGAFVFALLMGPLMALYVGPWTRAYAQLEPRTADVF